MGQGKRSRGDEVPAVVVPLSNPHQQRPGSKGWASSEEMNLINAMKGSSGSNQAEESKVDWRAISELVPGKSAKQCKEKWINSLRPGLSFEKWTLQEDYVLILSHAELGTKWQRISEQFLPHRPENGIKNHW